jgi:hypothetical protein
MTVARDVDAHRLLRDVRVVEGALASTPVAHLMALCAFSMSGEPLRDRIERLFVRAPATISDEDIESASERALIVEAARPNGGAVPQSDARIRIAGTADDDRVRALLAELSVAPRGSVLPWMLCAELLGTSIQYRGTETGGFLPYRQLLLQRFSALAEQSPQIFLEWLATGEESRLDDALRVALDALRGAATLAVTRASG